MNQATKGVILSGLVYPGIGQMFFGRTYLGLGFITLSTITLVVLIYRMAIRIYRSIDPLLEMLTAKSLTFQNIELILSQSGYDSWNLEFISLIGFVTCWVGAMVHAYFLGFNTERRQKSEEINQNLKPGA